MRTSRNGSRTALQTFHPTFSNRIRLLSVSSAASYSTQEIVMASSRKRFRISTPAIATALVATGLVWADTAFASQGPGGGLGSASGFTQTVMAILVWGTSALVVGFGLIGAVRRR
jgi:Na+-driven multidrug efflux pump